MRLTKTTQQYIAGESRSAVMFGSREVACANCGQTLDALKIINGAYDPVPSTGPKITSGTIALITLAAMAAVIAVGLPDEPLSTRPLYPSRHFRLGGVITESPFEAFAKLERERDLPENFIRRINATNPHENAWARFERSQRLRRSLRRCKGT